MSESYDEIGRSEAIREVDRYRGFHEDDHSDYGIFVEGDPRCHFESLLVYGNWEYGVLQQGPRINGKVVNYRTIDGQIMKNDKNGKKPYNQDILKYKITKDSEPKYAILSAVVKKADTPVRLWGALIDTMIDWGIRDGGKSYFLPDLYEFEVVGSIYDQDKQDLVRELRREEERQR